MILSIYDIFIQVFKSNLDVACREASNTLSVKFGTGLAFDEVAQGCYMVAQSSKNLALKNFSLYKQ